MKNQNIDIRPFDAATDTKTLSNIWFDASVKAHAFIGKERLTEQRQLVEQEYLPKAETWVAAHNGKAVGFISLLDSFVGAIFIDPVHQGMGIGRMLIAHALDRREELSLEVYTANEQALRFYLSLGFQELSRRDIDELGQPFPNATLHLKR